jgi:hypothetical protein
MAKFIIQPHGRLQEWIAHEKGYFRDEGLDYEFSRGPSADTAKLVDAAGKVTDLKAGAFESYEKGQGNKGVKSDISCACHWTVNQAASEKIGKMWGKSYVFTPGGIMVPPESKITEPEQLAGQEIAVGYHSGSHYTTIQALEAYLPRDQIKLSFEEGMLFHRMENFLQGKLAATTLFSGPYYFAEQLGHRKVLDTSFMIAAMINGEPDPEDVRKYYRALRRAQRDIDVRPELYTHYYLKEFPERFHAAMDTRRWGPGERIVFEPYTQQVYEESFSWIAERGLFEPGTMGSGSYEQSVVSFAAPASVSA